MKKPELKVSVKVIGVKKRCRKISGDILTLGNYPIDTDRTQFVAKAHEIITREMKSCSSAAIHFDYVEIEDCGLYQSETWMPFDERNSRVALPISYGLVQS